MTKFNKIVQAPKVEDHPVAILLRDNIAEQITEFLKASPDERYALSKTLFRIDAFPADLVGCEGADQHEVYQVDLHTHMTTKHKEAKTFPRMSTAIILLDKKTHRPTFYMSAYISPNERGSVTIYQMTENGPDYRHSVHWSSKDIGF